MDVFDLKKGEWSEVETYGSPPLGVRGYSCTAIGTKIYYFGGYCGHDMCRHSSLQWVIPLCIILLLSTCVQYVVKWSMNSLFCRAIIYYYFLTSFFLSVALIPQRFNGPTSFPAIPISLRWRRAPVVWLHSEMSPRIISLFLVELVCSAQRTSRRPFIFPGKRILIMVGQMKLTYSPQKQVNAIIINQLQKHYINPLTDDQELLLAS